MQNAQRMGRAFERLVVGYLRKVFGANAVFCPQQPSNRGGLVAGGDGGADVHLTIPSSGPEVLFGIPVLPGRKYFVEMKYVEKGELSFNSISPNLTRMSNKEVEGIFVVTNSFLPASTHFDIRENFANLTEKLFVINGIAIKHWIDISGYGWPDTVPILEPSEGSGFTGGNIFIHTRSNKERFGTEEGRVFYISVQNRGDVERTLEIETLTDMDWRFGERWDHKELGVYGERGWHKTLFIPPWQSTVVKVYGKFIPQQSGTRPLRQSRNERREDGARIVAKIDQDIIPLFDGVPPIVQTFKTAFTGRKNKRLRNELKKVLDDIGQSDTKAAFRIIHIRGEAGVGKSRLVDEILPTDNHLDKPVFHHTIDASARANTGSNEHWQKIRNHLKTFFLDSDETTWLEAVTDVPQLLNAFLVPVQQKSDLGTWANIFVVIEDLHHASEGVCNCIRRAIESDHDLNVNLTLVLTARDDDSYVNPHYKKLAAELKASQLKTGIGVVMPIDYCVKILTMKETQGLIAGLIEGIQEAGIKRIMALSGPVPNNIVQCIEYLLDASLLTITSRETLSIIDLEKFEKRSANLPETMEDVFAARFESLEALPGSFGKAAQEAILAATVFGTYFHEAIGSLVDGVDAKMICDELVGRRFFARARSRSDDTLGWHHENLLLFFGNNRMAQAQGVDCKDKISAIGMRFVANACLIQGRQAVWERLNELGQGDVATVAHDYSIALIKFSQMIAHAEKVETFSTLDAPTEYFDHVEYAVTALRHSHDELRHERIWKLLVLKCYIGAYHKGLRFEEQAFKYVDKVIPFLSLPNSIAQRCRRWTQTIDAQVHLDSGFIGAALERFMRLMHDVRLDELGEVTSDNISNNDWDMLFDMYNCLRLLFTYANFSKLAEANGTLAQRCVERSEAKAIEDMDLGDRALFIMLTNRKACIDLLRQAVELNEKQGSERHGWHSGVSLIAAELADIRHDASKLKDSAAKADKFIATCEEKSYHSILPRIHLLRAVIEYLLGCTSDKAGNTIVRENYFDNTMTFSNKGLEACELFSIGSIGWQLQNLKAIILWRRNLKQKSQKELKTALALIENEGLTFMGRDGIISAAPIVVANFVKTAPPDSEILTYLKKLHGFEAYGWNTSEHLKEAKRLAHKYHHIILGQENAPNDLIIDDVTKLAVVCWF